MGHAQHGNKKGLVIYILLAFLYTVRSSSFSGKSEINKSSKEIVSRPDFIDSNLDIPGNIESDLVEDLKDGALSGGLKDADENRRIAKRGRIDSFGFSGMLGKRGGVDTYGFAGNLAKRRGYDRYGFIGNLGKRRGYDRYGFIGSLGKRGGLDRYSFVGALGKRGGMDRYGFIGALGKRGGMDRYGFIGALGKRGGLDRYSFVGALGKRGKIDSFGFTGMLGKRETTDLEKESDMVKRDSLNRMEDRQINKISNINDSPDETQKRRKRSAAYPWNLDRKQRYYPSRWLRGIDRFSFGTRLGKRAPNYNFYPTLGKRDDRLTYNSEEELPFWEL